MNKILEEYYTIRKSHDEIYQKLEMETQRIVDVIKGVFKTPPGTWWSYKYYSNSDDNSPLPQELEGNCFPIYIERNCDSGKWNYSTGIPVKFFDMTNDEIRDYILKEIEIFSRNERERKEAEKKRREERKLKLENLKKSASEKLTVEEKRALGLK